MTEPAIDRLRVFVSSTIRECSEERGIVRAAIRSVNHEPILFEDIGARPHPPRELYKTRLDLAHVFVAIYRESYGWVAPEMGVSGVEDEFDLAAARGMDRLFYVYGQPSNRDPRLAQLVERALASGVTIWYYNEPEELRERVRDDLTAVISSRFMDQALTVVEAPTPDEILNSLLPNRLQRLRRTTVELNLLEALSAHGRLVVSAPLGGGKTIMLALLAAEKGWVFVDGQGLSHVDLLARMANAIRARQAGRPIRIASELTARAELATAWETLPTLPVVVDGARDPGMLWDSLPKDRPVLVTARAGLDVPAQRHFHIPALSTEEIGVWVHALRGRPATPLEIAALTIQSGGNPLYLRFYALGSSPSADLSLRELEMAAIRSLPARARELTSYLALSIKPLGIGDLEQLIGTSEGPESVADLLKVASGVVAQVRNTAQLVHEHVKETIRDQMHQEPARLSFLATRLGSHYEGTGRFVAAFHAFAAAGDAARADRILDRASYQALLYGGGRPAIPILRRRVELTHAGGKPEAEVAAQLALAFALKQVGEIDASSSALSAARSTAGRAGSDELMLEVKIAENVLDLNARSRHERVAALAELRDLRVEARDAFGVARIDLLLSAEHLTEHNFEQAEADCRRALEAFTKLGDEYGVRLTKINLAAALGGIDGREREAAAAALELQRELDPEEHPRERAALCNTLTRYYRALGDQQNAETFCLEAIRISEELGDRRLIVINRVNLGNIRRDQSDLDAAFAEYRTAEQQALAAGDRDGEASANELIASIHNEKREHQLAEHCARYAVSLARTLGDVRLAARSLDELAVAHKGQGDLMRAIKAYAVAARELGNAGLDRSLFASIVGDALRACVDNRRRDLTTMFLRDVAAEPVEDSAEAPAEAPDEAPEPDLGAIYAGLYHLVGKIDTKRIPYVVGLVMSEALRNVLAVVERRIALQTVDGLLAKRNILNSRRTFAAIATILMSISGEALTLGDVVEISERVARSGAPVYFKPHLDGAMHWTIRLAMAEGVVVTISQIDEEPRVAVATTILALLLAAFDKEVGELLDASHVPRNEVVITISSRRELETRIEPELLGLGELSKGFVVSESADLKRPDQPPILVVCGDEFGAAWRPAEFELSDVHLAFGDVLKALVFHLLGESVEQEILGPKIARLIREIGSRGMAEQLHARLARRGVR